MERPDLGSPDLRIHYLRVTNKGATDFTDMYDGAIKMMKSETRVQVTMKEIKGRSKT